MIKHVYKASFNVLFIFFRFSVHGDSGDRGVSEAKSWQSRQRSIVVLDNHLIFMFSLPLLILETTRLIISQSKSCLDMSLPMKSREDLLRREYLLLISSLRTQILLKVSFNLFDLTTSCIHHQFLDIKRLTFSLGIADQSNQSKIHSIQARGLNLIRYPSSLLLSSFQRDLTKVSFLLGSRSLQRLSFQFS